MGLASLLTAPAAAVDVGKALALSTGIAVIGALAAAASVRMNRRPTEALNVMEKKAVDMKIPVTA